MRNEFSSGGAPGFGRGPPLVLLTIPFDFMADEETYKVIAPVSNFNGTRAGVTFEEGEAEATEAQARELAWRGYEVPALEDDTSSTDEEDAPEELGDIDGIGPARSEDLAILGLETPEALAEADAEEVAEAIDGVDAEEVQAWQDQV